MKQVITVLLILIYASISYAEDVLIIHQGYANSHSKWKNRLEDAGHTVTSVNITSSSFPSDTTSYEQIYDVRYSNSYTMTSAIHTIKHYLQEEVHCIFKLSIVTFQLEITV